MFDLIGLQRVVAALFLFERTADNLEAFKQAVRYFGQTVAQPPRKALIDQALIEWLRYRSGTHLPPLPELAQAAWSERILDARTLAEVFSDH